MLEMKSKELETEKDMYFHKLSQLDEYLNNAINTPEAAENALL